MSNSKALSKKDDARLAEYGNLMDETPVEGKDLLLPRVLFMQPTSQLVADDKARAGEIRGSVEHNLLAEKQKPVEFIPFYSHKSWVVFQDQGQGKPKWIEEVRINASNAGWAKNEGDLVRYETINYFVLFPREIKEGAMCTPYLLSFRSTGFTAGKKMETYRAKLRDFKKPFCFKTFTLETKFTENDKGRFYVPEVAMTRDTEDKELSEVKRWFDLVKDARSRVDNSVYEESSEQKNTINESDEY